MRPGVRAVPFVCLLRFRVIGSAGSHLCHDRCPPVGSRQRQRSSSGAAEIRSGGGGTRFPARQHHPDAEAVGRSASRARTIAGGAAGSGIAELPQLVDAGNLRRAVRGERGGFGQAGRLVALPGLRPCSIRRAVATLSVSVARPARCRQPCIRKSTATGWAPKLTSPTPRTCPCRRPSSRWWRASWGSTTFAQERRGSRSCRTIPLLTEATTCCRTISRLFTISSPCTATDIWARDRALRSLDRATSIPPTSPTFRSAWGLPPTTIQMVPIGTYPGVNGDEIEADLDLEWAGAVARFATLIYVYSEDAGYSAYYAIDNNLAPVISESFGLCEYHGGHRIGWAFTTFRWRHRKAMRWELPGWLRRAIRERPAAIMTSRRQPRVWESAFPPAFPRLPRWAARNSTKETSAIGAAATGPMVARRFPISPRRRGTTRRRASSLGGPSRLAAAG